MLIGTERLNPLVTDTVGDARQTLAHKSKSFNWAAKLLSPRDADRVAVLYAFCRFADDIADDMDEVQARLHLKQLSTDLKRGKSHIPLINEALALLKNDPAGLKAARILVASLFADTGTVRIQTWDDLIQYAYGVAGTVGIMMCTVIGVRNPAALPFAVDLGIAMQLTNIARDVCEDARRDRIYLPAEALEPFFGPQQVFDDGSRERVFRAVHMILDRAEGYYASAFRGMRFIPLQARAVIMTAARIYRAIGTQIKKNEERFWESRVYVDRRGKLLQTLTAIWNLSAQPRSWNLGRLPTHDPALHTAICGLPGTNGRCL